MLKCQLSRVSSKVSLLFSPGTRLTGEEFPNIRIDYFRRDDADPPLAGFLSHVHSDHLLGLESLKAPFIYCSPATKEVTDNTDLVKF
jgi:phosphoribosyl 1,2-cyclic phosphodiesterase